MKYGILLTLSLLAFVIYLYPDNNLHIISCNVGQGDASLIIYKNVQILVDAGQPNSGVEECLGNHIPFWDRRIELVVITHPQLDHFGGFIDIFKSYTIDTIVLSSLDSSTKEYQVLKKSITASQVRIINPENNTRLGYGLMYLDVVWPTEKYMREHSRMKDRPSSESLVGIRETTGDLNNFSIVLIVRLASFEALFTGDVGPEVIPELLATRKFNDVEYIKIPHHGSRNGLTNELLEKTHPKIATISSGKGNSFGHPHKEVLEMLNQAGVQVFRTDTVGEIEIVTDGTRYWIESR